MPPKKQCLDANGKNLLIPELKSLLRSKNLALDGNKEQLCDRARQANLLGKSLPKQPSPDPFTFTPTPPRTPKRPSITPTSLRSLIKHGSLLQIQNRFDYPNSDDDDFKRLLLAKKEIQQNDIRRKTGIGFESQQKLARAYVAPQTPYNLLLFHETGVGKTAAAIAIAENFKDFLQQSGTRVLILTKNDNIVRNFKTELMKEAFTQDTYVTPEEREILNTSKDKEEIESLERSISRRIGNVYEFITMGAFINRTIGRAKKTVLGEKLARVSQGEKIKNLNNRLIIVDEAHNLTRNDGYKALKTVLDNSNNTRVVLLTATPVFDNLRELPELLNLVTKKSRQLPDRLNSLPKVLFKEEPFVSNPQGEGAIHITEKLVVLSKKGKKKIKKAAQGVVSYLRSNPDTFPSRTDRGTPLTNEAGSMKVVKCEMSPFQWNAVKKAVQDDVRLDQDSSPSSSAVAETPDSIKVIQNVRHRSIGFKTASDASTFVSPITDTNGIGLIGTDGFKATFDKDSKILTKLKGESLKEFSCKFWEMLKRIREAKGPVFVFSGFVTEAGVTLFSKVLQLNGFSKFGANDNKPKILLIDGSIPVARRDRLRKLFNSPENKHGERIKVLLITPTFSEGVTLKNVRQVHIMEPEWNNSRMEQVIGRAVRNRSHADLPLEERKVDVYRYAAVAPSNVDSIDILKYKVAEMKDRAIKTAERILKNAAIDCSLNKSRNQLPSALDNSSKCDYTTCKLKCNSKVPKVIDFGTYKESITKHEMNSTKRKIKELFKLADFLTLEQIRTALSPTDNDLVSLALDDIVRNEEPLFDKFNRQSTLQFVGKIYTILPNNLSSTASSYERSKPPMKKSEGNLLIFLNRLKRSGESPKPATSTQTTTSSLKPKVKKPKKRTMKDLSDSDLKFNENIMAKAPIYGSKYNRSGVWDGKFRIVVSEVNEQTQGKGKEPTDKRKAVTGQVCETVLVTQLRKLLSEIAPDKFNETKLTRPQACMELERQFTESGLMLR